MNYIIDLFIWNIIAWIMFFIGRASVHQCDLCVIESIASVNLNESRIKRIKKAKERGEQVKKE